MGKDKGKMNAEERTTEAIANGVFHRPLGSVFDFYLNGEIEGPESYLEWNHIIRTAGPADVIYLHINCYGGDMFAAIQLLRALSETQAQVVASVEGACMSAATFLFLVADSCEVSDHSMFMFHTYSGGTIGKGHEMAVQIKYEEKWARNVLESLYKDFLTAEEINDIYEGKDIWMGQEEVMKRLELRNAARQPTPAKKKASKKKA